MGSSGILPAAPTVITGTGSPLGVVTPSQEGLIYVDTAQTNGAREWVSTGTTKTSWIVTSGDTGWLDVSPLLIAGLAKSTSNGLCVIRRVDRMVWFEANLNVSTAGIVQIFAAGVPPAGFAITNASTPLVRSCQVWTASSANSGLPGTEVDGYLGASGSPRIPSTSTPSTVWFSGWWIADDSPWPAGVLP